MFFFLFYIVKTRYTDSISRISWNNREKRNFFGETAQLSSDSLFLKKSQQRSVLQQWAKACTITDLKVSISTTVFCFVCYFFPLTWKSLPDTFGWAPGHYGSFPYTQTCTHMHRVWFTAGPARKASVPGFFQQLPWVSIGLWNGHIFAGWPATINLLCWGSMRTLNLYS